MSLGFDQEQRVINAGDVAELVATLYDKEDNPVEAEELISVQFTIQHPDGKKSTPISGEIEDNGTGTLNYKETSEVGHYLGVAAFETVNGIKSTYINFEVIDPFEEVEPSPSWVVANDAWEKFEDLFDSSQGGPWLRDMTLSVFNKQKMERFIDDALMDINLQNPPTNLTVESFVTKAPVTASADLPLITQGLLLQIIRHLIRSYVEQPNPSGAQIAWHDRRDYQQRWESVYSLEKEQYMRMVALYKRRFLNLGMTVSIVSSKAGRLLPSPMRVRQIGRGYW